MTYHRWRREFGGLQTERIKRMKDQELENQRLRKPETLIADIRGRH